MTGSTNDNSLEHLISILRRSGRKDTQQRRTVLSTLLRSKKPLSTQEICKKLEKSGDRLNVVTIYRVLESIASIGLIHQHGCNGKYSLCTAPQHEGIHTMLHCTRCGKVEEMIDTMLSKASNAAAHSRSFHQEHAVAELHGSCALCSA